MIDSTVPGDLGGVIERWKQRHAELARLDANVKATALIEEVIADLELLATSTRDELNLTEAARISGYTPDHLSRLIRDGKLKNYGRKGAPRLQRSELPMRPTNRIAPTNGKAYNVAADVRSIGTRR